MKNPKPFNQNYLPKQDGHQVFFAQYGNEDGPAIVVCHGGPGGQSKRKYVKGYDLDKYHVIVFDQRGCGQSKPSGKIEANTTDHLLSDMARLRQQLKIKSWYVAGGSWGSTLALAYAQKRPGLTRGLLLSSIFLANDDSLAWSFSSNQGVKQLFPDVWQERNRFLDKFDTDVSHAAQDLLSILKTGDEEQVKKVVAGVSNWEANLLTAQKSVSYTDPEDVEESDIVYTKIFLHYEANHFFLKPNQLLENLDKIKSIPAVLVHGRYDVLCPLQQMWDLKQGLDRVETVILPSSNHRLTAEGEIARKLAFNLFLQKQR